MMWVLAALLLLQPALTEPGTLRLVATGPAQPITWILDGKAVGATGAREALDVAVPAGPHTVLASTDHHGAWQVMARLDSRGPGIAYVPAWTASSAGDGPKVIAAPTGAALVLVLALAGWAQSKRP